MLTEFVDKMGYEEGSHAASLRVVRRALIKFLEGGEQFKQKWIVKFFLMGQDSVSRQLKINRDGRNYTLHVYANGIDPENKTIGLTLQEDEKDWRITHTNVPTEDEFQAKGEPYEVGRQIRLMREDILPLLKSEIEKDEASREV